MANLSSIAAHWEAVERLLDEALALPADGRAAWLDSLAGDRAQHREALQALLRTQAQIETGNFLFELPQLPCDTPAAGSAGPRVGGAVGPYRLVRELGRGGMGLVWLAERDDTLTARRVALKLPRVAWGDAFAGRLAREREILATLEHEHIARLYDAGVDAQGRPYIAMQYVEGEPIDEHCRRLDLALPARIELLLQAMSAVAHAHARLVVHRDIKPGNILVSRAGRAMLLDFGVAKLLEQDLARSTALTELSGRALTPDYASPEQIRGAPLGTASDVYSLGVVAYELLTGVRPYRLRRGTAAELEEAILGAEPGRASDAATSVALRKALRGDLDAILQRALRKSVAERYASVDAFADDLRRHLRGEPVQARPDSRAYRAARFVGRHRLAVAMSSALLVAVFAGSAVSLWQAARAREQERLAVSQARRERAVQDLYLQTLSRLAVLGGEHSAKLTQPGGVSSVLLDTLHELATSVAQRPDDRGAQLEAAMLQLNYANRFEDSLAVGQDYLAHLKAHDGAPSLVINTYAALGRTLFQLHRYDESEAMRRAGLAWASDAHDRDTEIARMGIASDLGGILAARGRRDEALAVLTRADAEVQRRFGADHLRYEVMTRRGVFHLGFDDTKALGELRQARAEMLANGTADPDFVAYLGWRLGDALLANGQAAEAESTLKASMALYRRQYGRDSRNAMRAFGRLVAATARRDTARATALIDDEQRVLGAGAGGLSPGADRALRACRLEVAWLAGDATAAASVALPPVTPRLAPATLRDDEPLVIDDAQALLLDGHAAAALALLEALQAKWPERALPTVAWLRIEQALSQAQLAAGQAAAARRTAEDLLALLDKARAGAGSAYRGALAVAALAAVRSGDPARASALLDRLARQPVPAFASVAERADVELARAQALRELGRADAAAAIARGLLPGLAGQNPNSPRLALARQLLGPTG